MATVKQIKKELANIGADVIRMRNGNLEVKRSFFYRFDRTAETWANTVRNALAIAGIDNEVTGYEDWNAYPKTSYFVAVVKVS